MKIRTVVVDDEPLARRRILSLLKPDAAIEVVGECGSGEAAVESITSAKPDLVFLDVQMPNLDGFGVLQAIAPIHMPLIVFVTAFDQYAVKAFDAHAVDYLLKPFRLERFREALKRARQQLEHGYDSEKVLALVRQFNADRERIVIRTEGKVVFLKAGEIDWIQAAANYVHVHCRERHYAVREKISSLEESLPANKFMRIHRSIIVNLDKVREIQPCGAGEFVVLLSSGRELPLGQTYRRAVESTVGQAG
jgi:two-component system LytT family response regulator